MTSSLRVIVISRLLTCLTVSLVSKRYMRGVAEMKFSGSLLIGEKMVKLSMYICKI